MKVHQNGIVQHGSISWSQKAYSMGISCKLLTHCLQLLRSLHGTIPNRLQPDDQRKVFESFFEGTIVTEALVMDQKLQLYMSFGGWLSQNHPDQSSRLPVWNAPCTSGLVDPPLMPYDARSCTKRQHNHKRPILYLGCTKQPPVAFFNSAIALGWPAIIELLTAIPLLSILALCPHSFPLD